MGESPGHYPGKGKSKFMRRIVSKGSNEINKGSIEVEDEDMAMIKNLAATKSEYRSTKEVCAQ